MINEDVKKTLDRKILLLQGYLAELQSYLILDNKQILDNKDKLYSIERIFQLVVDEAVDINAILIYQLGGTVPDSSKSSFYELVPLNIIDQDLADKIAESAKVRNQITHDYDKLSPDQVVISTRKFFELYKVYFKILVEKFIKPFVDSEDK